MIPPTEPSSKEDIRGQLSDIQKRLFKTSSKANEQASNISPTRKSQQSRRSLPIVQSTPDLGPESKGNDMNFVVGLSENLLGECRRLNAENVKLKSKLKASMEQVQVSKSQIDKLKNSQSQQISNETVLNDKNWELQSNLVNLNDEISTLKSSKDKLSKLNSELNGTIQAVQKDNDSLILTNQTVSKNLADLKSSFAKQLSDLNSKIQDLNDENDSLHSQLQSKTITSIPPSSSVLGRDDNLDVVDADDTDEFDLDSLILNSNPQKFSSIDPNDPELEIDNLRANLNHSNRTISKLRSALLKLKNEANNSISKSTPMKSKPSKPKLKKEQSQQGSRFSSPSKRNSKFLVINDDIDDDATLDEPGKWEDFLDVETPSKPSKITDSIISDKDILYSKKSTNIKDLHDIPYLEESSDGSDAENSVISLKVAKKQKILDHSGSKNVVMVEVDEYDKLTKNNIQTMDDIQILESVKKRGFHLISQSEYKDLLDEQEMEKRLYSKGLKTLPLREYEDLVDSIENPELEYIKNKASGRGYQLLENSEVEEFASESYIVSQCAKLNLHPISEIKFAEFQNLITDHEKPSKSYLTEKANDLGFVLSPSSYYDEIVKKANNPSLDYLLSKVEENNLVALSTNELAALKSPDIQAVCKRAKDLGSIAISNEEYNALKEPTFEELIRIATKRNLKVLTREEYQKLLDNIENPTFEHIQSKAEVHNHRLISQNEFDQFSNPSIEYLGSKTKELNHSIISTNELEDLRKLAYEPPLSQVKLQAETFDLVTLSKQEYTELYNTAKNPSIDFISESAKIKGYELVKKEELELLTNTSRSPSIDHLANKAKEHGYSVVSEETYRELENKANEPTIAHIIDKAMKHEHKVVELSEFESLHLLAHEPDLEHISEKAKKLNHTVLSNENFDLLKKLAYSPDFSHIQSSSEKIEHTLISNGDLVALKTLAYSPSIAELSDRASKHDCVLLNNEDYQKLREVTSQPNIEFIESKASQLGYSVLEKNFYENLLQQAERPSIDQLQEKAGTFGYRLIDEIELKNLKESISNPSKESLGEKVKNFQCTMIETDLLRELEQKCEAPGYDDISRHASTIGYTLVLNDKYDEMVKISNSPDISYIKSKATDLGFTVLESQDYQKLIEHKESPTIDFIRENANRHNLVAVQEYEYNQLVALAYSPSVEHISEVAKKVDRTVISNSELNAMKEMIESPTMEYLKEKLKVHKLLLISSDELSKVSTLANSPPENHIKEKAAILDLIVTPRKMFEEMESKVKNPDRADLEIQAQKLGLVLIDKEEWNMLVSPGIDILMEKAKLHDQLLIDREEHRALVLKANKPLKDLAAENNFELITPDNLQKLENKIHNPELKDLKQISNNLGSEIVERSYLSRLESEAKKTLEERAKEKQMVLLDETEYNKLLSPSIEQLEVYSNEKGYVLLESKTAKDLRDYRDKPIEDLASELNLRVLPISEYTEMLKNSTSPEIERLKSMAFASNHILVSEAEYNDLVDKSSNPALTHMESLLAKIGYVAMPLSESESLLNESQEPLEVKAERANMKVIPCDEYLSVMSQIESPSLEYLHEKAKKHEFIILPHLQHADLIKSANRPLVEIAECNGKVVLDKDEYTRINEMVQSPSLEHITQKAEKRGHSIVPSQELDLLKNKLSNPGIDYIKEKATLSNFKLVQNDEYETLLKSANETLEERANKAGMKIVGSSQYEELVSPSLQSVKNSASLLDCAVVHNHELENLKARAEESVESKAKSLNLKLISIEELDKLNERVESPTLVELESNADKLGYSVVKVEHLEQLKGHYEESIHQKAAKENMKVVTNEEYDNFKSPNVELLRKHATDINHVVLPATEYDRLTEIVSESITDRAIRENMQVLPIAEYRALNGKLLNPSLEYLQKNAPSHDHVLISSSDLNNLKTKANETLEEKLHGTNTKIITNEEYDELLLKATKPSIKQIKADADFNGFAVVSKEELGSLKADFEKPISQRAEESGFVLMNKLEHDCMLSLLREPTVEFLRNRAETLGMLVIPVSDFDELQSKANKDIDTQAKESGKVALDAEKYKSLLDEQENLKLKIENLEFITNNEKNIELIKQKLNTFGYTIVPEKEFAEINSKLESISERKSLNELDNLLDPNNLTEQELRQSCSSIGKVLVDKEEYESLCKNDEKKITELANGLGLSVVSNSELLKLKQTILEKDAKIFELNEHRMDKETIKQLLAEWNLVLLEKDEYKNLNNKLVRLETESIAQKELQSANIDKEKTNKLDRNKVSEVASSMGLLCIPEKAFVPTTVSRVPDINNVTVIPTTYYNKLTRNDSLSIEKVSEDVFRKFAEKRGYRHKDQLTPILQQSSTFQDRNFESKFTPPPTGSRLKVTTPSSATSTRAFPALTASESIRSNLSLQSKVHSLQDSVRSADLFSMATNVSLTDKSMIPAITQVVIGEYLFKYYRRLGPLSGISENRHERYFWVHPYSLTLYWSHSNPVLTDPSEIKTKAAAILDVKSVEDNNPLPTGLYHKSIIVFSHNRSIKITCPNRQRHNIWYNALRYLIHRNLEDLSFDLENNEDIDSEENNTIDQMHRHHEILLDVSERHSMPRQRIGSGFFHRSESTKDISRFRSLRE